MNALADQDGPGYLSQHPAFARWFTAEKRSELRRPKTLSGPCVDCGKHALKMDDPFHLEQRPLCPDDWLQRKHEAVEMVAKRFHLPAHSLKFSALFLPLARAYLLKKGRPTTTTIDPTN